MAHGMSVRVNTGSGAYAGLHRQTRRNLRKKAAVRLLRFLLRNSPAAPALAAMSDGEVIAAVQDSHQ